MSMNMNSFSKHNNIAGWVVFAVSLIAYVLTAAPTADWWDCMEFTATSYKLEVGHPPGAPLFMMLMRLFTMLAGGNTAMVGFAANLMSCTASAFCILFMFWTITCLARKMYGGSDGGGFDAENKTHVWTVIGAGAVGALAYAFSDTFWFSAVESEVYALSSMFTALVVWLMLCWEDVADRPDSTRWLILIAYMMGLSIGVHILNLLTIPALVLIYYFRKSPRVTWKGVVVALAASLAILAVIYKMIMPWTVNIGAWFDRQFVNGLGLPPNSGLVTWALLLLAMVGAGVWVTHRKGKVLLNTILLCVGVILIGYSSYASVVIRSSANPPMNSNRPENAYALLDLLGRNQYGSYPLLYGQSYSSPLMDYKSRNAWFMGEDGKYHSRSFESNYVFAPGTETLFPRMWDHNSAAGYEGWMGEIKKRTGTIPGYDATYSVPVFGEHMRYFFTYQLNYMYWRYFMWNFVGRQDDIQGRGDILHGNWLSGVGPIDELYLGPQDDLPEEVRRNPARNRYFFLPFLLGVLGLIAQMGRDRRGTSIVAMLFVMTGLALVVYFANTVPFPPRERDYIYAGSFYAFSIWIGLGVLWAQELAVKWLRRGPASAIAATAVCAAVPVLMAAQGWDDHDRSGRSIGNAYGHNALVSTLPNSIIMNYGDNDTFPLWYNQEVENVRPDVRIMNMSYIAGEWYIEQMRHAYNASAPVPFALSTETYRANNPRIDIHEVIDRPLPIKTVLDFVANPDPKTKMEYEDGTRADYIPTRRVVVPVDKANALAAGIVRPEDAHLMVDSIELRLPERSIDVTQLVLLDLLANFDWSRPLYFTTPLLARDMGLDKWLQTDGWVYRLVPIKNPEAAGGTGGRIDAELTYDLLMNKYRYGGSGTPGVNIDWNSVVNLRFVQHQYAFTRLVNELLARGDRSRAVEVLDRSLAEYPLSKFDYEEEYFFPLTRIESYYAAEVTDRADTLLEDYANTLQEYVEYYLRFKGRKADLVYDALVNRLKALDALALLAGQYGRTAQYEAIDAYLDEIMGDEEEGSAAPEADSVGGVGDGVDGGGVGMDGSGAGSGVNSGAGDGTGMGTGAGSGDAVPVPVPTSVPAPAR